MLCAKIENVSLQAFSVMVAFIMPYVVSQVLLLGCMVQSQSSCCMQCQSLLLCHVVLRLQLQLVCCILLWSQSLCHMWCRGHGSHAIQCCSHGPHAVQCCGHGSRAVQYCGHGSHCHTVWCHSCGHCYYIVIATLQLHVITIMLLVHSNWTAKEKVSRKKKKADI